jgi:hypothetical protein
MSAMCSHGGDGIIDHPFSESASRCDPRVPSVHAWRITMKRLMLVLTVLVTASSLSGCIIDDRRPNHYYDHHDNYHCDSRYNDCRGGWRH